MQVCNGHEQDDPASERARRAAPEAEGESRPGGLVALRLSPRGGATGGRSAERRGDPRAPREPHAGAHTHPGRGGRATGARSAVIVTDASAVVELLLGGAGGHRMAARLFAPGE